MRRIALPMLVLVLMVITAVCACAAPGVNLYADSAPNAYGATAFAAWQTSAYAAAVNGSFINMANGAFPNSTYFAATDAIVYSTGDLGKRLHWVYWLPNTTIAQLSGCFQVKDVVTYKDGTSETYDWGTGTMVADGTNVGWIQPSKWIEYQGGVVGTFGNAWWAYDDAALPYDTDGKPYNQTDAADVAAVADWMYSEQAFWTGVVRYRNDVNSEWSETNLQLTLADPAVPEPMSMLLGALGLSSIAGLRRLRRK